MAKGTMPKVRRSEIPRALMRHLVERVADRSISEEQLGLFADWLKTEPEVCQGLWFKRFPEMIVCGEGELVKTFLVAGQIPFGKEI
jgi:hypothetical protein